MMNKQQFRQAVDTLLAADEPVHVHVGCGPVHFQNFLHIDIRKLPKRHPEIYSFDATNPWPCPDECVQFIFHEDFLEHLDQRGQFRFLAETFRVMRHGATQYVSIPSLEWVMRERSKFLNGAVGVYDEWKRMDHRLLHTRDSLLELGEMIGFRAHVATRHPLATRPNPDGPAHRDPELGNIFAYFTKV